MAETGKERKIYSVADIIASQKPLDVDITWQDGVFPIRINPIRYGEVQLLSRGRAEGPEGDQQVSNEVFITCIKRRVTLPSGEVKIEDFTMNELMRLPPGLVVKIMNELNKQAGITLSPETVKNL